MDNVLVADLGGTSLRVARVARSGSVLARAIRSHAVAEEADALAWWDMLVDAIAEIDTAGVRGICIGGFTRSQVLVDADHVPVRPAQCFPDARSAPVASADEGTWMTMTAFHPVARLAWVARHDPGALARARHLLQPAEFLATRLTGRVAADRIANCWAVERESGTITTAPLRRANLDPGLLPELLSPGSYLGSARGLPGLEGVPVFSGSMDTWVATIGAGIGRPGDAYVIAGTTDAGGVLTAVPVQVPGLVTLPWGDGVFHTGGPSAAGGACIAWGARLLGLAGPADLVAMAAPCPPRWPLLFLPALIGSRAPYWQPHVRGALVGLDAVHGPADVARAILEGIAFADRDLLGGLQAARIVIAGGGASDRMCQVRADVLGRPVSRIAGEPGIIGAAILAWMGLGGYSDLAAAQSAMVPTERVFTPDPASRYEALYAAFRRAAGAMTNPVEQP